MFIQKHDKSAVIYKDHKYSYTDLLNEIADYADLFDNPDKVVIYSENRPEWIFAFYSAWKKGAIAVPVDFMSTADEVAYILKDCRPEVAFCSHKTELVFRKAMEDLDFPIKLIILENIPTREFERMEEPGLEIKDHSSTALIIYTSGTTGTPKGVMLSYDNLLANIQSVSKDSVMYTPEDRLLVFLPLHHTLPLLSSVVCPLFVGGTIVITPTMNSSDIIKTLKENQITMIIGVPRFYTLMRKGIMEKINSRLISRLFFFLAEKFQSRRFSKIIFKQVHQLMGGAIKLLGSGGAAVEEGVERDFRTLGFTFLVGFGMTETAPLITFARPESVKIGSAGQPLACNEVRILDGEVITRGANIMQGYYNRPDETADIIKDGWLHTGDLGRLDADNHLFITGRKKEIIILPSGKNVNPVEGELKLEAMSPLVGEVGIFLHKNILQAVIVPDFKVADTKDPEKLYNLLWDEVISPYNESVSPYKQISQIFVSTNPLPRTRLDKIKRFELHTLIEASSLAVDQTEPVFKEYTAIRDFLSERCEFKVNPGHHIERELGLDSLDRVGFFFFIKNSFGVEINEDHLSQYGSVKKISEYVRNNSIKSRVDVINWGRILKEKVKIQLPRSMFTQNLFKHLSRLLFKFIFRLKIKGIEKIPSGPFILAPNHQSFFDGMLVAAGLNNRQFKNTYFYAKAAHVKKKWVKFLAERNNVIVVDIQKELKLSIQKLAAALKTGGNIMIFPEGTRSVDGSLGSFKKTFAILSRELNIPVVPVAIEGAYDVLPRGSKIPRLGRKIKVSFLDAVEAQNLSVESIRNKVVESIQSVLIKKRDKLS